ncbi:ribosome hibernation-promoting factor, HPF/YfiA family [Microvirga massiliensis]|uniref:ribosome hibernation-promoting factor, HPF/YfiA family n=1 Tax=Microvirga massiliensis TaxID=1033741 RepID=UPI00062B39EC|nr:ribosome-associated translation inhibitor RaiA [Microvirga massiliensis]
MKLSSVDRTITVESATVDLGEILPEYVRKNVLQVAGKYFGRLNAGTVYFKKEGITYYCTVNMQMGALRMMSGEAKNKDIYAAFNSALNKVAKQLRRAKRALRDNKAERTDKDVVLREGLRPSRRAEDEAGALSI